jgi:hypothetical protein
VAICKTCNLEMHEAASCVEEPIELVDATYEPVRWGDEQTDWEHGPRCGDCGVLPGGVHHPGCDIEECPRCHEQLITCECWPDEVEAAT